MRYKVDYQPAWISLTMLLSLFALPLLQFLPGEGLCEVMMTADFIVILLSIIAVVLQNSRRSTAEIEGDRLTVRHAIGLRVVIPLEEVTGLQFEHYRQRRSKGKYSHYMEDRVRVKITRADDAVLELSDSVTLVHKHVLRNNEYEVVEDETSEIWQLYRDLESLCPNANIYLQ